GFDGQLRAAVRGHDDDQRQPALFAIRLQELQPGHARHAHVAEYDVGLQLQRPGETLLAVADGMDGVVFIAEDQGYGLPQARLVVNDENRHRGSAVSVATGRKIVKLAPASPVFSTRIVPPIASTRRADTASPRPVPCPGSLVVTNGSNTWSI